MWRKFRALSGAQRLLLGRAFLALIRERVRLWVRREALVANCRLAGRANAVSSARRIAWAVNVAGRFVPGATCLVRALAAQRMLARNGFASELHIGVTKSGDAGFEAHAWVESEGAVLVGRTEQQFAPLLKRSAA